MEQVPRKFLGISNLIFILPDDFEGSITDALALLMDYVQETIANAKGVKSTEESAESIFKKLMEKPTKDRVTMKYTFYSFDDESQTYVQKDHLGD